MNGITIGQYYPSNSILHKLDPRTKLTGTMILIISLFICNNVYAYFAATVFVLVMIYLSKVPISYMLRGLKTVMFLLILSVSFNLFLTAGTPILQIWKITVTIEGVEKAIFMALRLIYLIIGSSILTLTTTPNDLTDGLEKGLGFLKVIKIPVHEMAMMMSIALRFIPILVEETDKIMKAQMARGADFENGNIIKRAKNMVPLLVPLFVSAFRRASDLAMAMEARCYHGGNGRTKMKPLHFESCDVVAHICIFVYLALIIVLMILL